MWVTLNRVKSKISSRLPTRMKVNQSKRNMKLAMAESMFGNDMEIEKELNCKNEAKRSKSCKSTLL